MEFDNSFDVPLSPAEAWTVLLDIRRIAPCMPGAALTEVIDRRNFRGKIAVRLGPVALAFAGKVEFENIDEANHRARVRAQGIDDKGRGAANATATFRIEPADGGARVLIHTDLMLSGAVAQYGRGVGMIQATAAQIIGQFAANLRAQLEQAPRAAAPAPVSGVMEPGTPAAPHGRAGAVAPAVSPAPQPMTSRSEPAAPAPLPLPAKPISGFSLIVGVVWRRILALFSKQRT